LEQVLIVTTLHPIAACAGFVGMICFVSWPLCRTRPTMLMTYIGNNLGFMLHYSLLGQWTAVAMNGVMALQTVVAMFFVERPRLRWVYYLLMPALAGGSLITWHGLPSLLAGVAATLSAVGRVQNNEIYLRAWLLTSAATWLAHDFIVGSLPGMTADILSMTTGAVMLLLRSSGSSRRDNQPRRLAVQP
jgi:hypothetical protein